MTEELKHLDSNNLDNDKLNHILKCIDNMSQYEKKITELNTCIDTMFAKMQNYCYELYYANLLHDTIINSAWLKDKSFSLHGWAANYSFIYMLYRILDSVKPQHILEMGMGQTSRLTSQYVAYCNQNANLDIIENDIGWISAYQPQLAQNEHIKIHQCDLDVFQYEESECYKYKNLNEVAENTKYDLIIIDGPFGGGQKFPRSNILDLIKNHNLADDFVIIFDDTEREGEKNIVENLENLFNNQNIKYENFQRSGMKTQTYIASASRSFIKFL